MKKVAYVVFSVCFTLVLLFSSCKDDPPVPKIGLVSGLGGFDDRGFNQDILSGFLEAQEEFGFEGDALACELEGDIATNIGVLVAYGYDLIITCGFHAAVPTLHAAEANPDIDFVILDYVYEEPVANIQCVIFEVDQSSFPCGFLAAWWADKENPESPRTGFVGGPEIYEILQFSQSYVKGVEYFNSKYNRSVEVSGFFASSFTDTLMGAQLADSAIRQGASVIFAFAGQTGNGALYQAKESGKWAIGVDVDQYISIPAVGSVLLTSCMKNLGQMLFDVLESYHAESWQGGTAVSGNLLNGGVGLAPFHDFEAVIPDSIRTALTRIEEGIIDGTIETGWR
ncbi:MAG: hypothetical protein A2X22_14155 [Bacteroidetes bacterium GWF2_49_14]|nr:MAG: hypothetical protein A2X22_14155 [Bacteroidetes bacterium GWF2_49_14]HBB91210.1 hypothetical protein [Bacteroidales bacterium]